MSRQAAGLSYLIIILASIWAWKQSGASFSSLWRSPDRQGQLLMDQENYAEAAEVFTDPMQLGNAHFKAGEFKEALAVFNTIVTTDGKYNRANCQMMLGKYDAAIELYDAVLTERPDWSPATTNREIAIAQKAALAPTTDDAGGTGGKLGADEIVFDTQGKNNSSEETEEVDNGEPMSDDEMRALWLRKVQTKPADFLRAKFSYQFQRDEANQTPTPPSKP